MKTFRGRSAAGLAALAGLASGASAQSVSTGFGGGIVVSNTAADNGTMFDVVTFTAGGATVNSIDIHSNAAAATPITVDIYTRASTYLGFNSTATAWTLLTTINTTSAGPLTGTPLTLPVPVVVPGYARQGFYVNIKEIGASVRYFAAASIPANPATADMGIDVNRSAALGGLFNSTNFFYPRGVNATVHYTAGGGATRSGACCMIDTTCTEGSESACFTAGGIFQGDLSTCAGSNCTNHPEVEPNSNRGEVATITLSPGHTISGVSTGTTTTAASMLPTSVDFWKIRTVAAAPGIYRHRMILTNTTTTNSTTLRTLTQTAAAGGPWPGPVGVATTTDAAGQSHLLSGTDRTNIWYGFGKQETVYFRVSGATSSTGTYSATIETTPITPTNTGLTLQAGMITLDARAQGHTNDTVYHIYDSNFNPVAGAFNDDASTFMAGIAASSTQSFLRREYPAGTYYIAATLTEMATNQGTPCDDNVRTGDMTDFADVAINVSTITSTADVTFTLTDAAGSNLVSATRGGGREIGWYRFDVTGTIPTGACCKADGTCEDLSQLTCSGIAFATYSGNGTDCGTTACAQPGACCFTDGTCQVLSGVQCAAQANTTYSGNGTNCTPNNCPQPGACCWSGGCAIVQPAACTAVTGGTFQGAGSSCAACPAASAGVLIGMNFASSTQVLHPQNWRHVSAVTTSSNLTNENGDVTPVALAVSATNTFSFIANSSVATNATPLYTYSLANMNGYVFRSGTTDTLSFVLSNLTPNMEYEYWFVGHRASLAVNNIVKVSDGDTLDAFTFEQHHTGSFFSVNATTANNTMQWNDLSLTTTASSTGTIRFNVTNTADTLAVGALAIRPVPPAAPACYANCDESTADPVLNVADFTCFLQKYAGNDAYANCDESTAEPTLNVADFTCFLQKYAGGCP